MAPVKPSAESKLRELRRYGPMSLSKLPCQTGLKSSHHDSLRAFRVPGPVLDAVRGSAPATPWGAGPSLSPVWRTESWSIEQHEHLSKVMASSQGTAGDSSPGPPDTRAATVDRWLPCFHLRLRCKGLARPSVPGARLRDPSPGEVAFACSLGLWGKRLCLLGHSRSGEAGTLSLACPSPWHSGFIRLKGHLGN